MPAGSKLKNGPVRPHPDLDVVDDQQDVVLAAEGRQPLEPGELGDVDAPLGLHRLDDHRRRQVDAAPLVAQQGVEILERVDVVAEVAVVGHAGGMGERNSRAAAFEAVARDRERPQRHAVEGVGEADHRLAPGGLARQLERALHGVRPGRARELHLVAQAARPQDHAVELLEEVALRTRRHVETVRHAVRLDVLDQAALQARRVVPVVQCTGAAEEVEILPPVPVVEMTPPGALEDGRERTAVASHLRLQCLK